MKFINKEGKVFDTINEEECGDWCPLYCKKPIPGCREFYLGNPVETASLIGCKVADDEYTFTVKLCDKPESQKLFQLRLLQMKISGRPYTSVING